MRICSNSIECANFVRIVRILFKLCELCEFVQILYTVRIFFGLCEFCANCAKSCSNFCTQKEHNKVQGPVQFFCANFLFVFKEHNRTTIPTRVRTHTHL